jgi:hypothetical protein
MMIYIFSRNISRLHSQLKTRHCDHLNTTAVKGLTEAQRRTLKAYGAVEELRIENDELRMEEME